MIIYSKIGSEIAFKTGGLVIHENILLQTRNSYRAIVHIQTLEELRVCRNVIVFTGLRRSHVFIA